MRRRAFLQLLAAVPLAAIAPAPKVSARAFLGAMNQAMAPSPSRIFELLAQTNEVLAEFLYLEPTR